MPFLASWLWLLLVLPPLVVLERWVHKHLQGIWLLIFRDADLALVLYSLAMLPGVLLHEGSHWLMATLLGVRTGRFSVIPERTEAGMLRLGYVETAKVDFVREALIGAAPLLAGTAAIIFVGYARLGVGPVGEALTRGDLLAVVQGLQAMTRAADFWLWLYFVFTVSNSMLPSASDQRAWLPVLLAVALLGGVLVYAGFGSVLVSTLSRPLDAATHALALAFTLTVSLNLFFAPLIWLVERGIMRLTGMKVEY
ncbi:MAG: hypothetical protein HY784_17375 [Chloroflexi bacterium]|nr:hypothetical protein [Chloroflexota bacterium]